MQRSLAAFTAGLALFVSIGASPAASGPVRVAAIAQSPGTGPAQPPDVEATDPEARLRAWAQHQQMEQERIYSKLAEP